MDEKKEQRFMERRRYRNFDFRLDYYLLLGLFLLMFFGLVMLASASSYFGIQQENDAAFFIKKQIRFTLMGLVAMYFVSYFPYQWLAKLSIPAVVFSAFLVYLLQFNEGFIHGVEVNGARRWLAIGGMQLQVTDIIRISVILFLAMIITVFRKGIRRGKFWGIGYVFLVLATGAVMALFVEATTDNLSTAIIILGIAFIMLAVIYPHWGITLIGAVLAVIVVIFVIQHINGMELTPETDYHIKRIKAWLDPFNEAYISDTSWQTVQSLYAIGRGGWFGVGLGNSVQKLGKLPEPYNDFIFSIICEELGFLGVLLIIVLYIYFLAQVYFIACNAKDTFGSMLSIGILAHFSCQVLVNLCVCTNLFPNTGVALPFISYGGTAQIILLGEIGILLSIYRYSKKDVMQDDKNPIKRIRDFFKKSGKHQNPQKVND